MYFRSFLFVCTLYKATFLNRSDNTWRHLRLHILSPLPTSSAPPATYFHYRMTSQTLQPTQSRACLRRKHIFWKILHLFRPLCLIACVCVFTAPWLRIPDIFFFAIYMICVHYSHGTFFCNVLNALRPIRPLMCVCSYVSQPPRGYIFQTFRSSLLQHIPSHTSVLSPTPTSAHAITDTIVKFLFIISENNAVHLVSRLVVPGNAGPRLVII